MANETQGQGESSPGAAALIRDADGSAYAVPTAVLEAHRLTPERRAELEAQLRASADGGAAAMPPADAPIFALTPEELAPYRLSDEAREGLDAQGSADDADVQGHQYVGQFVMWMPTPPERGGWLDWRWSSPQFRNQPHYVVQRNLYDGEPYPGLR